MDLRRDRPPHVPEVPRLVLVARGSRTLCLRVAHDPAIAPAVGGEPVARARRAPVPVVPGCRAARRLEIHRCAQLVLRVSRPCRGQQRLPTSGRHHPARERRHLVAVAAVCGLDREGGTRRSGRADHRGEVRERDPSDRAPGGGAGARCRDQVGWRVAGGDTELRVYHASVPVRRRAVAGQRVAHGAGRGDPGFGGLRCLSDGQGEHGGKQRDDQPRSGTRGHRPIPGTRRTGGRHVRTVWLARPRANRPIVGPSSTRRAQPGGGPPGPE